MSPVEGPFPPGTEAGGNLCETETFAGQDCVRDGVCDVVTTAVTCDGAQTQRGKQVQEFSNVTMECRSTHPVRNCWSLP